MGDDRPTVYFEPDSELWVYRASGLGNCFMGLVAGRLQMEAQEHPPWLQDRFAEGHAAEQPILDLFASKTRYGYKFELVEGSEQIEVEVPVGTSAIIRGHIDKLAEVVEAPEGGQWKVGQRVVVESKAFGPDYCREYTKHGISGFPYYVTQLTVYMAALGLPGVFVVGKKEEDGTVKVLHDVTPFYHPPGNLADAKMRVLKVEQQAKKGVLPECDMKQYPCQWFWLGGKCAEKAGEGKGDGGKPTLTPVTDGYLVDAFDVAIKLYRHGQDLEKQAKQAKQTAATNIAELIQRVVSDVPVGTDETIADRETSLGRVRLPDGTEVEDYVRKVEAQTVERGEFWTRYPKITKGKGKK